MNQWTAIPMETGILALPIHKNNRIFPINHLSLHALAAACAWTTDVKSTCIEHNRPVVMTKIMILIKIIRGSDHAQAGLTHVHAIWGLHALISSNYDHRPALAFANFGFGYGFI